MDEVIAYKYVPPARGLQIIEGGRIGFTPAAALNDPFELLPSLTEYRQTLRAGALRESPGQEALIDDILDTQFAQLIDRIQRQLVLLSLSLVKQNELMWAHYAASHTGIALGFAATTPFFGPDRIVTGIGFKSVSYSSQRVKIPAGGYESLSEDAGTELTHSMYLRKSRDWDYEQEARVLIEPRHADVEIVGDNGLPVYLFNFQPQSLKQVILGSRMTAPMRQQVIAALRPKHSHVELCEATLDDVEFKVNVRKLEVWI